MKSKFKRYSLSDILDLRPTFDPLEHISKDWSGTLIDILRMRFVAPKNRLWMSIELIKKDPDMSEDIELLMPDNTSATQGGSAFIRSGYVDRMSRMGSVSYAYRLAARAAKHAALIENRCEKMINVLQALDLRRKRQLKKDRLKQLKEKAG